MTDDLQSLKVALVHDALVDTGGAERVVLLLCRMFPSAPLFTLAFKPDWTFEAFRDVDVRTSFVQKLVVHRSVFRTAFPLYPLAFEQFDLSGFDLVLSSSAHWAKGVITRPETCHVCYCNSPSRVAWRYHEYVAQLELGPIARSALPLFVHSFRQWDAIAANRVDYFVAGSQNAARRIAKCYRRPSTVLRSPIDVRQFQPESEIDDYYLIVSRLNPYKRLDIAIEAFRRSGRRLKIVGRGPMFDVWRRSAPRNVEFLGRVSDDQLRSCYARCRALVVCAEEDYGLTPLEANASGRPVIAYGAGGAIETVVDGRTGVLFGTQTSEALNEAIDRLEGLIFHATALRAHAEAFDVSVFRSRLSALLIRALADYRATLGAAGKELSS